MNALFQKTSAAVLTFVLLAFPLAASAEIDQNTQFKSQAWSAHRIMQSFVNAGGTTSTSFDNDSLDDSGFDFVAIVSHPCYSPIGEHLKESCRRRFGVYGDLQAALSTTFVRNALVAKFGSGILSVLGSTNADLAETAAAEALEVEEVAEEADVVNFYGDFRERRIQLWDICQERFENNAAACYQDNLRLLQENQISIRGNVNHHVTVTR